MSEAPKLWRIIAGRTVITEGSCIRQIEHEFIVEGETLNDALQEHDQLLTKYEYIKASAVVI